MLLKELVGVGVINRWQRHTKGIVTSVDRHDLPLISVISSQGYKHKLPIQDLDLHDKDYPNVRVLGIISNLQD